MNTEIKITERFTVRRDSYQWILSHYYEGKDKDGNPAEKSKQTYHATIKQCCAKILELKAEKCETVEQIIDLYENAVEKLTDKVEKL